MQMGQSCDPSYITRRTRKSKRLLAEPTHCHLLTFDARVGKLHQRVAKRELGSVMECLYKQVNGIVLSLHTWCLTSTETIRLVSVGGRRGDRGMEVGGELYTYRCTVTTRMTPALRWAAMRAILMFDHCEGQTLHLVISGLCRQLVTSFGAACFTSLSAIRGWGPSRSC